jgi:AAA family ATP:ADP antiporter
MLWQATKYAIFDPTKEMTYIPLSKEARTQGKAAIDVLGARLGKSMGALVQQLLVVMCGSIIAGAPVVATLFYMVIALWIGTLAYVMYVM